MYTVSLLREAEQELEEALQWYEMKQSGLAERFYSSVSAKLTALENNPLLYAVKFSERYRSVKVDRFPYLLIYRVDEGSRAVFVISVFHTSQSHYKF